MQNNPFATRFWTPGALPFELENGLYLESLAETVLSKSLVQIVGPHGSGKSTLLKSLARYFVQNQFVVNEAFLNDRQKKLSNDFFPHTESTHTVFLLDGYEQLSFQKRFLLRIQPWQKTAGFVLTTHRPAWHVPVLYRTEARFERFRAIVGKLSAGLTFPQDDAVLHDIFEQSGGNFRTAFFMLYDLFSDSSQRH